MSSGPHCSGGDVVGEDLGEEVAHRVEVARDARGLRHVPAVAIEDGGGVVEQLAHDGRAAGAPHRDVHLGGGRGQRVVDDLELDRRDVDGGWSWLCSLGDQVAAVLAPAGPALGQQHGGVGLLDHGGPGEPRCRRRCGRGSTRRSPPAAGHPDLAAPRRLCARRSVVRTACLAASAAGRWPRRAATRSPRASRGWHRRNAGGGCRGNRRSAPSSTASSRRVPRAPAR